MKGQGSYKPKANERVLISPPNADNLKGYVYDEYDVFWIDETFILYGNKGNWPNLHKIEHCHIKQMQKYVDQESQLVCNRENDYNTNRCITCGVKAGHPCELQSN